MCIPTEKCAKMQCAVLAPWTVQKLETPHNLNEHHISDVALVV